MRLPHRWLLMGMAVALFAADLLLLAGAWSGQLEKTRPAQYVWIESTDFEPADPQAMPWLNDGTWQLGDQAVGDMRGYARAAAISAGNMTREGRSSSRS